MTAELNVGGGVGGHQILLESQPDVAQSMRREVEERIAGRDVDFLLVLLLCRRFPVADVLEDPILAGGGALPRLRNHDIGAESCSAILLYNPTLRPTLRPTRVQLQALNVGYLG